jgi:hypothetical protein
LTEPQKILLSYECPQNADHRAGVWWFDLILHLVVTVLPLLGTIIPNSPQIQMIFMFCGIGFGAIISFYLWKHSLFRRWAKWLFGFYGICLAWLFIAFAFRSIFAVQ